MFVIINKFLIPKGYKGIALFPFIILKNNFDKQDKVMINHEKIHIRQQLELLIFPFYILYGLNFLINLIKYKNRELAYRNIIFEKEAYANETNLSYLRNRKLWGFMQK
jgi:hypothetical protein